jgi:hypothetical protein
MLLMIVEVLWGLLFCQLPAVSSIRRNAVVSLAFCPLAISSAFFLIEEGFRLDDGQTGSNPQLV